MTTAQPSSSHSSLLTKMTSFSEIVNSSEFWASKLYKTVACRRPSVDTGSTGSAFVVSAGCSGSASGSTLSNAAQSSASFVSAAGASAFPHEAQLSSAPAAAAGASSG